MRIVVLGLLAILFVLATAPASALSAGRGASSAPPALIPASVVMEWFSSMHPHAGDAETVFAQAWLKNRPVQGARLAARVLDGNRTVQSVRGGLTDSRGKASAKFTVPGNASGKTLIIKVSLTFGKRVLIGSNRLHIG